MDAKIQKQPYQNHTAGSSPTILNNNNNNQKTQVESDNEQLLTSNFTRHVIKQRSGNFPHYERRPNSNYIYPRVSSNESTNRGNKLLQGSNFVSRRKLNTDLYENVVFYNGSEHKLLTRTNRLSDNNKKRKLNNFTQISSSGGGSSTDDDEEEHNEEGKEEDGDDGENIIDLNTIAHVEEILRPIESLSDVVTHQPIKRTFMNNKILRLLELQTALMIEKAQLSSSSFSDLLNVFLEDDPLPYLCHKIQLPDYDHNLHVDENAEYIPKGDNTINIIATEDKETGEAASARNNCTNTGLNSKDGDDSLGNIQTDEQNVATSTSIIANETRIGVRESNAGDDNDDDDDDAFFALPQYKTSSLLEKLIGLATDSESPITEDDVENTRQLTQIVLQRNQEFIKNLQKIRLALFKAERIRSRIVSWAKEYANIPEDDVTIPSQLKIVKRSLISATTNLTVADESKNEEVNDNQGNPKQSEDDTDDVENT
ncbi:Rxt2p SCDLUD_000784 [Saccharomycodes ludwigii]|uniref:Rxt2p n=1 Tax=Saccharomycodes ludwigii TaxID=36035 RepID=UPI001E86BD40|nr:hypothetical protein SCDLUD_000784 [Saccharomycodes ludwigii]KAH3903170.1 hypothetical protein SCDLUD_000784 [Saccharomycodes ludwigii]